MIMNDNFKQVHDRAFFINYVFPVLQKYCDIGGAVNFSYEVSNDGLRVKLVSKLLLLTQIDIEMMEVLCCADTVTIYTASDMVIMELWFRAGEADR